MILIAIGSNLPGPWGAPQQTVQRALRELNSWPTRLAAASHAIVTEPFGRKNQPPFVNAVAEVETQLSPEALMVRLHMIEFQAGRQRRLRWGPRTLDLDLLDYHGLVRPRRTHSVKPLVLPHPGIQHRLFVLLPLAEIAPRWRHPLTRETAQFTIRKLSRLSGI
jgi:2-amino-4-hydroxy-6-hydroxymethyldihydropteridine diphosphokinase